LLITKAGVVSNTMRRNPDLDIVNNKDDANATTTGGVHIMAAGGGGYATAVPMGGFHKAGAKKTVKVSTSADNKNTSKETFITALALTRQINGKEQRIVVSGDADLFSNSELGRYEPKVSNFYFSTALFSWLDYGQYPVDTSRPDAKDNRVTVSTDHVSFLKIIYIYVLPGLILIFAAIFLIRRKRK
jgi:ABC-2 type transport system permease protein